MAPDRGLDVGAPREPIDEVAGSIAGDDTVFIAVTDRPSLGRAKRRLESKA